MQDDDPAPPAPGFTVSGPAADFVGHPEKTEADRRRGACARCGDWPRKTVKLTPPRAESPKTVGQQQEGQMGDILGLVAKTARSRGDHSSGHLDHHLLHGRASAGRHRPGRARAGRDRGKRRRAARGNGARSARNRRYLDWLAGAVTFDFGNSIVTDERVSVTDRRPVQEHAVPGGYAAVIAVPFAIILGIIVALLRNSIFDRVANVLTLTSISSPGILPRLHPDPLSSR